MKVDYGVRALVELATHYGEGSMQSAEIASRQCIPQAYLDQLLTTLQKYGFINTLTNGFGIRRVCGLVNNGCM